MPPPAYIDEGGNIQSGCDVCGSVCCCSVCRLFCDSVFDNPRISETAEAKDFKYYI